MVGFGLNSCDFERFLVKPVGFFLPLLALPSIIDRDLFHSGLKHRFPPQAAALFLEWVFSRVNDKFPHPLDVLFFVQHGGVQLPVCSAVSCVSAISSPGLYSKPNTAMVTKRHHDLCNMDDRTVFRFVDIESVQPRRSRPVQVCVPRIV